MNVFAPGSRHQPWVWQVTGLCFVLGLLLAGSIKTVGNIRRAGTYIPRVGTSPVQGAQPNMTKVVSQLEKQITDLNASKTKLEKALGEQGEGAKVLNQELQKMKLLAGLSPVEGAGIVLTLQDSKAGPPSNRRFEEENYIIHDVTLQRAIHELNASGAEAVSINGQRVIGRTSIRCVGPTTLINNVPLASPFEIRAIGDAAAMAGGLNIPEGFIQFIHSYDPAMARIEKRAKIQVPAYSGATDFRFAKPEPAKDKPVQEAKLP
jgi:uncharacterized protein YlxW (UPF0749 family)